MIRSRADLIYYLDADRLALGRTHVRPKLIGDDIWKFQRALRNYEFVINCRPSVIWAPIRLFRRYQYYKMSLRCNFELPPNVAGPGLSLAHRGPVIVNPATVIGANCRIHSCVNIGTAAGAHRDAPKIGNNVYLGPGAKLFGPIRLSNGIAVAAQAVVNTSFEEENITIGGIPARKISGKGAASYIVDGAGLSKVRFK